jgi:DNA-binding transcriptional LysR family regulator
VRAFELLDEGESQVAADRATLVGTVRVAAPSDLARNLLLPLFDEFMRAHPGLQQSAADRVLALDGAFAALAAAEPVRDGVR